MHISISCSFLFAHEQSNMKYWNNIGMLFWLKWFFIVITSCRFFIHPRFFFFRWTILRQQQSWSNIFMGVGPLIGLQFFVINFQDIQKGKMTIVWNDIISEGYLFLVRNVLILIRYLFGSRYSIMDQVRFIEDSL